MSPWGPGCAAPRVLASLRRSLRVGGPTHELLESSALPFEQIALRRETGAPVPQKCDALSVSAWRGARCRESGG